MPVANIARLLFLVTLLSCSLLSEVLWAQTEFDIDADTLSEALLQFSRQSGQAVVFSDKQTRRVSVPSVIGTLTTAQALDQLLADTNLQWEAVDAELVAVGLRDCDNQSRHQCTSLTEMRDNHPAYLPALEETYVYGRHFTGSQIQRNPLAGAQPVERINHTGIEASGAQSLAELLRFVPSVVGNAESTSIANGGDGTATVTLRGLPANNTLVLLDGKRVANDGLAGDAFDLNSISPAMVERIDILKHGASASYGSDAIAGIVNIITKSTFSGFLLESYAGVTAESDLQTTSNTLQFGKSFAAGNVLLNVSHYQQDPLYSRDRAVSASADTRHLGGTDKRSSATADARITLPSGQTVIASDNGLRPATQEDLFDFQTYTTAIVPLERDTAALRFSYDLSDEISSDIALHYASTDTRAELAPTPVFTAFEQIPLTIAADQIYNPYGIELNDVRRRIVELPPRVQRNRSDSQRISISVDGVHTHWYWDAHYAHSYTRARERLSNLIDAQALARALGPSANCQGQAIDGCEPVNLSSAAGHINANQLSNIVTHSQTQGYSKLAQFTVNAGKQLLLLPYGGLDVATGFSYLEESTRATPDNDIITLGGNIRANSRGKRYIAEYYAEALIPLWRNSAKDQTVDLELALRHSHYSDFGDTSNPRLGLRWQVDPSLLVRINAARGFRAPSLAELYQSETESYAQLHDPCTDVTRVHQLPGCTSLADDSRTQFLTITGGNTNLTPEVSHAFSLGMLWKHSANPLTVTFDWYDIHQRDVVNASAQYIVDQNAEHGLFNDAVTRDSNGNLTRVIARFVNSGDRRVRGLDLGAHYSMTRNDLGKLSVDFSASYIDQFDAQLNASAPVVDYAGSFVDNAAEGLGGIPKIKTQLGLNWRKGRWRASYELYYISAMDEQIPGTEQQRTINAWTVHDIQLSHTFKVASGLRWSLGVDNIFDVAAPYIASAFNDNIDGRTHELKGQYWYTRLTQRF